MITRLPRLLTLAIATINIWNRMSVPFRFPPELPDQTFPG